MAIALSVYVVGFFLVLVAGFDAGAKSALPAVAIAVLWPIVIPMGIIAGIFARPHP